MKTLINTNQITYCRVYYKRIHKIIKWKDEEIKKFLFIFKLVKPAGFYWDDENGGLVTEDEIKEYDLYVDGNTMYYLPKAEFYMSNGKKFTVTFDTDDETNIYLEQENLKNIKWLK